MQVQEQEQEQEQEQGEQGEGEVEQGQGQGSVGGMVAHICQLERVLGQRCLDPGSTRSTRDRRDPGSTSKTEQRISISRELQQDTPEYLVYAQYKRAGGEPGAWRKVYVTPEYLLKHLPKADVLKKVKEWRDKAKLAEDAVFGAADV